MGNNSGGAGSSGTSSSKRYTGPAVHFPARIDHFKLAVRHSRTYPRAYNTPEERFEVTGIRYIPRSVISFRDAFEIVHRGCGHTVNNAVNSVSPPVKKFALICSGVTDSDGERFIKLTASPDVFGVYH